MSGAPSEHEAAAIAAAIERFVAETAAPPASGRRDTLSPWQRAALTEGVGAKATIVDLAGEGGAKWLS
jgi:hypothetical protein